MLACIAVAQRAVLAIAPCPNSAGVVKSHHVVKTSTQSRKRVASSHFNRLKHSREVVRENLSPIAKLAK